MYASYKGDVNGGSKVRVHSLLCICARTGSTATTLPDAAPFHLVAPISFYLDIPRAMQFTNQCRPENELNNEKRKTAVWLSCLRNKPIHFRLSLLALMHVV